VPVTSIPFQAPQVPSLGGQPADQVCRMRVGQGSAADTGIVRSHLPFRMFSLVKQHIGVEHARLERRDRMTAGMCIFAEEQPKMQK